VSTTRPSISTIVPAGIELTASHSFPGPNLQLTPRSFGQATGTSGVGVSVGKGVSVEWGVRVGIPNVGNGEGSITGAAGGAISDQLQANAASTNARIDSNRLYILPLRVTSI